MSIDVPDEGAWTGTGLVPDAEPDAEREEPTEHSPAPPRPDLRGEAAEHDVIDQAVAAPEGDPDDYPEG